MTNKESQENTLDENVRRIVREELANMFNVGRTTQASRPQILNQSSQSVIKSTSRDRSRSGTSAEKGKVTNPATDRRLKVNRVANA